MRFLTPQKTYFSFTVDVDPDLNLPVHGQTAAISKPVENGEVRFESCAKGLKILIDLLNDLNISGTFFIEARTAEKLTSDFGYDLGRMLHGHEIGCHSYMHEDFLGKDTGAPLDKKQMREVLETSIGSLQDHISQHVSGFRAPYLRINDELASILVDLGFEYDSSVTLDWYIDQTGTPFFPYYYFKKSKMKIDNDEAILEIPIPNLVMPDGRKMTSYMWPYIEGDISFEKYGDVIKEISTIEPSNSIAILATHPWHLVETFKNGAIPDSTRNEYIELLKSYILGIIYKPQIEFVTLTDYVDGWHSRNQERQLNNIMRKL